MNRRAASTTADLRVEALVGTGSVGEVWRARLADGTTVALKRMLPHAARHEGAVAAFEREARLYERFDSAGIPRCFGHGRDEQGPYLLLEYVDGTTLSELLGAPVPVPLALRVARDVLAVLEIVHDVADEEGRRVGLVHRDLSPMNVLVGTQGTIKLADFGIARSSVGTHATTGVMAKGTLGYMSPEQARGEPLDARSDLFAVGALLHEMIAGTAPYDDADPRLALARARAGDVRAFEDTVSGVDPSIAELVDRALSAEPIERFGSARQMRLEVERLARGAGMAADDEVAAWARSKPRSELPAGQAGPPSLPSRSKSSRTGKLTLLLLLVVGSAAIAVWQLAPATGQSTQPPETPTTTEPADAAASAAQRAVPSASVPPVESVRQPDPPTPARAPPPRSAPSPASSPAPQPRTTEHAVLDIGSSPSFAYVSVDGRKVGATPLFGLRLPPGRHTVTVEREGLGSRSITIDLQPGERATKVISLP